MESLPELIQTKIFSFVLQDTRRQPANIAEASVNRDSEGDVSHHKSWSYGPSNVFYEKSSVTPNANGLLCTNKHTRKHMQKVISELFPKGPTYKLDVILVNEHKLWATWLCVPFLARDVHCVDACVRVFGILANEPEKVRSAFMIGDGSPPQIEWCFYYLLEHFIYSGPQLTQSKKSKPCVVQEVNIHFALGDPSILPPTTTEENAAYREWRSSQGIRWHGRSGGNTTMVNYAIHPTWLAREVAGCINSLLYMSYHTANYGMILFENVGKFHVTSYDGTCDISVNVGDKLSTIETFVGSGDIYTTDTMGHISGDCRVLTFWNWKKQAVEHRLERGLDVPKDLKWPTLTQWQEWHAVSKKKFAEGQAKGHSWMKHSYCMCEDTSLEDYLRTLSVSEK